MLIRAPDEPTRVVGEAALPTEAELHDALTSHPELIPTSDLGMGQAVVVGRESGLTSGYADLVLVDDQGQICLVEVKNVGNPDTRRVVAQLLDYAASLWGSTVEEFEARVLHKFLEHSGRSGELPGLGEYVSDRLGVEHDDPSASAHRIAEQLGQALAAGEFALVVAAPQIPVGVQRVLEYLNARGQRFYGLEVSYFRGPVECFVPRLVVKPLLSDPAGERGAAAPPPMDRATFLDQVPERCRQDVAKFIDTCEDAGADVLWRKYGPSITVTRQAQRQVAYLEPKRLGITLTASGGFPEQPFEAAKTQLANANIGTETKDAWYRNVSLTDTSDRVLAATFEIALGLVRSLAAAITFESFATPLQLEFARNDHNLWQRQLPALAEHHGRWLRGHLMHITSGHESDVQLIPLAQGQPGWKPSFRPASARTDLWPATSIGERYRLTVDATGVADNMR